MCCIATNGQQKAHNLVNFAVQISREHRFIAKRYTYTVCKFEEIRSKRARNVLFLMRVYGSKFMCLKMDFESFARFLAVLSDSPPTATFYQSQRVANVLSNYERKCERDCSGNCTSSIKYVAVMPKRKQKAVGQNKRKERSPKKRCKNNRKAKDGQGSTDTMESVDYKEKLLSVMKDKG